MNVVAGRWPKKLFAAFEAIRAFLSWRASGPSLLPVNLYLVVSFMRYSLATAPAVTIAEFSSDCHSCGFRRHI